jgi:hypothetical protein
MRRIALLLALAGATQAAPAMACSPDGEYPLSIASAYKAAAVVLHARVLSQKSEEQFTSTEAKIRPIKVLKGRFTGDTVSTGQVSMCGVGGFEVGREYVFFFRKEGNWYVNNLAQPESFTTQQVLQAIQAMPK